MQFSSARERVSSAATNRTGGKRKISNNTTYFSLILSFFVIEEYYKFASLYRKFIKDINQRILYGYPFI